MDEQELLDINNRNLAVLEQVDKMLWPHIFTLAVKRRQTAYKDDYGNEKLQGWLQEVDYFIDNVLLSNNIISEFVNEADVMSSSFPEKTSEILILIANMKESARELIRNRIDMMAQLAILEIDDHMDGADVSDMDGISFEHHCAKILRDAGWEVRVTQSSSDQGIDIVASWGGVKGVFQCKRYSKPVGNAAVQEVIAGKTFERASFAVVVSNSSYTKSAKQLANSADVRLIHISELSTLADSLGLR